MRYQNYMLVPEDDAVSLTIFDNTFQNQPSIPDNGVVKSYFLSVKYYNNPVNLFLPVSEVDPLSISYNANIVDRPRDDASIILLIILLVITICTLVYYVYVMSASKTKWLSEQQWLVAYLFFLILYQNPVYCVLYWYEDTDASAVFSSYVLDSVGQTGFFVIWLMFADSIRFVCIWEKIMFNQD